MMENEFQLSMMGELTFFIDIQLKQTKEGIFIHQAKYTKDLMKKFNMAELKPVSTPMSTVVALDLNENGEAIDQRVKEHDWLPPCFTCYTSLYLLNYVYHCARMSSNEMWTFLLDHI
jgi:hypothetical protein